MPRDRLTQAEDPKRFGKKEAEAVESLGGFGGKMDPGKHGGSNRPIFEFRTIPALAVDDLQRSVLSWWDFLANAHRQPPSLAQRALAAVAQIPPELLLAGALLAKDALIG